MSIVVVQDRGRDETTLIAEVDALEPLGELYGPAFTEEARVDRRALVLSPRSLVRGKAYRVIYQDTAGAWYEGEFRVLQDREAYAVRLLGTRQPEEIPSWIRARAQVVTGA